MNTDDRLIDLETKISHQEFLIETLNRTVSQQELTLYQIEESLAAVVKQLKALAGAGNEIGPADQKPPHY